VKLMDSPVEILSDFVGHATLMDWNGRRFGRPGQLTEHMSPSYRAGLSKITSEGIAKMRVEPWETEGVAEVARRQRREMLLDFDRKILRR
jgi:hypothetical protein